MPNAPLNLQPASNGETLSAENFTRLAIFIQDYSGIKMPVSKRTMLEGRLRRRTRVHGHHDVNDYCRFLFENGGLEAETIHLIDAVTTNKTEFFREPVHFAYLEETLLPNFLKAGRREIKVWSAACSIGAEPYTLAMVLDAFCQQRPGVDYAIFATDICTEVLNRALAGRYPDSMIDPIPDPMLRAYVRRAKDASLREVRMAPSLRAKISFGRLNLMDDSYPLDQNMDIIFCRNILIYFDKKTQAKVLSRLCRHLGPNGYLFLGHSESIAGLDLPVRQVANTVFQKC